MIRNKTAKGAGMYLVLVWEYVDEIPLERVIKMLQETFPDERESFVVNAEWCIGVKNCSLVPKKGEFDLWCKANIFLGGLEACLKHQKKIS